MRLTFACLLAALLLCSLCATTANAGDYILKFQARTPAVISGESATLEVQTTGAGRVYIYPDAGLISVGDYDGLIRVRVWETTTYTLIVQDINRNELERASLQIEAGPFGISYFRASEVFIGRAETTTLSWHIDGMFDWAQVVGVTTPSDETYGSVTVAPGSSENFELRVSYEGVTSSAFVYVEVSQEFEESRFFLSWEHDQVQPVSPGVAVYSPFTIHVLAMSLEGNGIRGYEFGVELPPGLQVVGVDYNDPLYLNIVEPPEFIVGYAYCIPTDNYLYRIATLHVMAMHEQVIDSGFITLRPAVVQSVPDRLAYVTCYNSLEGSEFNSTREALVGPPLYLTAPGETPTGTGPLPTRSQIRSSFPNPFNPETTIRFDAMQKGRYEFHIIDTAGRRVRLLEREVATPGSGYEIRWNGMDERGAPAASGVYFVQLRGPNVFDHHRIALIK